MLNGKKHYSSVFHGKLVTLSEIKPQTLPNYQKHQNKNANHDFAASVFAASANILVLTLSDH